MNTNKNILEQFERMDSIEPTAEWEAQLMKKLKHTQSDSGHTSSNKLILLTTVMLVAVNLFWFSNQLKSDNEQQSSEKLKNVANELLISTSSSKY